MDSFDIDRFCVYFVIFFDVLYVKLGIDFLFVKNDFSCFNIEYMCMLFLDLIFFFCFFLKKGDDFYL